MSTWNYLKQKLRHILLLKVTSEWYDLALHFSRSNKNKEAKTQEEKEILNEKIFVIDDGDHSTMLFAYEY